MLIGGVEPSKGVAGAEMIRFYCECCGDHQEVEIEPITKDDLNPDPWGDIVCKVCYFVIATVSADGEGVVEIILRDPAKYQGVALIGLPVERPQFTVDYGE